MFAEIQQRVAEGRGRIAGGWWIEPDCNIPGGESFVRHGLLGQRYFKARFGVIARTGFNVDSFGHAGTLPQILKKSGRDAHKSVSRDRRFCRRRSCATSSTTRATAPPREWPR